MDVLAYLLLQIINGFDLQPIFSESNKYKNWIAQLDLRTCYNCRRLHGKVWLINERPEREPRLHNMCRCRILVMKTVKVGTATINGLNGADWTLKYESKLPDYYLTSADAKANGWKPKLANLGVACPNKMIFSGEYKNRNSHLPYKEGRVWYEADINYRFGYRNNQRVVFSNDGLIFVTYDHYRTFFEIV